MDAELYGVSFAFIAICALVELTPGPNMTYLAIVSLSRGRRAGLATVAGIALGLLLVGLAVALGFGAVLDREPLLYETLRWLGVIYLFWLAWQGWQQDVPIQADTTMHGGGRYFRRGLITNLLNPKAAMFYMVMLPNFAGEGEMTLSRGLTLTLVYVAIATGVHLLIALFSVKAGSFLRDDASKRRLSRVLSLGLVAVALWFAVNTARA